MSSGGSTLILLFAALGFLPACPGTPLPANSILTQALYFSSATWVICGFRTSRAVQFDAVEITSCRGGVGLG
ncbi:hypothetical protein F5Y02DRAFT_316846 [Annulohypoxylon stygium]|nr:hypothetical protein F5Y02DRAFT_316846 [Annulohypoxylon stygium]